MHESEVAQSCPTLNDPMDCSLPGSSVHGIFQARVLEWVAIAFSNEASKYKSWDLNPELVTMLFTLYFHCFSVCTWGSWWKKEWLSVAVFPPQQHEGVKDKWCWVYFSLVEVILLLQSNLVRVHQFHLQCLWLTLIYPSHLEEGWGLPVVVTLERGLAHNSDISRTALHSERLSCWKCSTCLH